MHPKLPILTPILLGLLISASLQAQSPLSDQQEAAAWDILEQLNPVYCGFYDRYMLEHPFTPSKFSAPHNIEIKTSEASLTGLEHYSGCLADGYQVVVNGVMYNEANPTGREIMKDAFGRDSIVDIQLSFHEKKIGEELYIGCTEDSYSVEVNGTVYNESNPKGEEVLQTVNGCDSIVYIDLLYRTPPVIELEGSFELCEGEPLMVSVTGEQGVSYKWFDPNGDQISTSPSLLLDKGPVQTGVYELEVTGVNTCTSIKSFPVEVVSNASLKDQSAIPASICLGDTIQFSNFNQDHSVSYQVDWDFGDGSSSKESGPSYHYQKEGIFPIKVEIKHSECGTFTFEKEIAVIDCQSSSQKSDIVYYDIAPEPQEGHINVEVELEEPNGILIRLMDAEGTVQFREILDGQSMYVEAIENIPHGSYFLEIWSPSSASFVVQEVRVE